MSLVSGWDGQFTCPSCDQIFFNDSACIYDHVYGDSICLECVESLEQERRSAWQNEAGVIDG